MPGPARASSFASRALRFPEGKRPKILAVVLQQVECVQDGLIKPAAAVELVEGRHAVGPADDRLAVEREREGSERGCRGPRSP
jgi:hypothetical protein